MNKTNKLKNFYKNSKFEFQWHHIQDNKNNSNLIFSANINYKNLFIKPIFSNINLIKKFKFLPIIIILNGDLIQDFNKNIIYINLPNVELNIGDNIPFYMGQNILLNNLIINYYMKIFNIINIKNDFNFLKEKIFNKLKFGVHHYLNLKNKINLFTYFKFIPSITYNEFFSFLKTKKKYDINKEIDIIKNKFKYSQIFNFKANMFCMIYALKKIKKNNFVTIIQHIIKPEFFYLYTYNFSKKFSGLEYYKYFFNKNKIEIYNFFENKFYINLFKNPFQKIIFCLKNNLEIKTQDYFIKNEQIVFVGNLDMNINYTIIKNKLKWDNIVFNGDLLFLKNIKINFIIYINSYREYLNNIEYYRVNLLKNFYIKIFNLSIKYSLNNKILKFFEEKKYKNRKIGAIRYEKFFFNQDNYAYYDIPWSLNVFLDYSYNKNFLEKSKMIAFLKVNGNILITPYWKITFNAYYDITYNKITNILINFERNLRSFNINFSWNPINKYNNISYFYFGMNINLI